MKLVDTRVGKCSSCGGTFDFDAMAKHLESCEGRKSSSTQQRVLMRQKHGKPATNGEATTVFRLLVMGDAYPSTYWMLLEAPSGSRLKDLDRFLKETWVECCGHLSQFVIEGRNYAAMPSREFSDRSMNIPLGSVLRNKVGFQYEYDFGTTTELDLKVLSSRRGEWRSKEPVLMLVRNAPPVIPCASCDQAASTQVCSQCIYDDDIKQVWFCDKCSEKHECGEEMLLPVVNSPRVGMCGYTG